MEVFGNIVSNFKEPVARSQSRLPIYVLLVMIILVALFLRLNHLEIPAKRIGDEVYYVPNALEILGIPSNDTNPYAGQSHPPLGKMIIAVGISFFGDNPIGWRIMSVVFGTLMIPVFYLLVTNLLRDKPSKYIIGLLAAFFLSFENLTFYFSRVARIDIYMLFFLILGLYFLSTRWKLRWLAAGFSFSLAFLSKEAALVVILPIIAWLSFVTIKEEVKIIEKKRKKKIRQVERKWIFDKQRFKEGVLVSIVFVVSTFVLWYVIEWIILEPKFPDLFTRVSGMVSRLGIDRPARGRSEPWQWLINQPPTRAIGVVSGANIDLASLSPVGPLFNPHLKYAYWIQINWLLLLVTLPIVAYLLYRSISDEAARLCATWWIGSYFIWLIIRLIYRGLTYLFYYLPLIPPIVIGISFFLGERVHKEASSGFKSRAWTITTIIYSIAYLFYFFYLYPVPI